MPKTPKSCMVAGCDRPKFVSKHRCYWHWLSGRSIDQQVSAARARLARTPEVEHRARVPEREWPEGERWCAGCQWYVPLWYCTGSRCRACSSEASHEGYVARTYNLAPGQYAALLALQEGRCAICRRRPGRRRLAVDHDHSTGKVRGLLCADNERGCNHAILGPLEANTVDTPTQAAARLLAYLQSPPYDQLTGTPPASSDEAGGGWQDDPAWS